MLSESTWKIGNESWSTVMQNSTRECADFPNFIWIPRIFYLDFNIRVTS